MPETLKLRIDEGRKLGEHAKALNEAISSVERDDSLTQRSIQKEIDDYFGYLRNEGPTHREEPGTTAEFASVMRWYMPIPEPFKKVHPLRMLVTDLSALYASTFLNRGGLSREYYDAWKERRIQDFDGSSFYDAMPLFEHGSHTLVYERSIDLETKALVLELMADLLPDDAFDPTEQLKGIQAALRITPAQLLALQIWQRRHTELQGAGPGSEVEKQLGTFFIPINGALENTLLYWIADPRNDKGSLTEFSEYLFVRWGWLRPISYTAVSKERMTQISSDELRLSTIEHEQPKAVIRRFVQPEGRGFPCVIDPMKGHRYSFTPVPILPIGGSGNGKTSFLCAFTDAIIASRKGFEDGTTLRSQGLLGLLHREGDHWRSRTPVGNTVASSSHEFEVGRTGMDPNRWVRMELSDYQGEFATIEHYETNPKAKEFQEKLGAMRGFLFFIDDRVFNPPAGKTTEDYAKDLAAFYQRVFRDFMQRNIDCHHIPIAFVINKADLVFGADWFEQFGTTHLVLEGSQRGIHLGVDVEGDPTTPYERLCKVIRYNKAISRRHDTQHRVLEILKYFNQFFSEILRSSYRYQIFLTTSVNNSDQRDPTVRGVAESMQWMVQQLLLIYGQQARLQLDADITALDELIVGIVDKMHDAQRYRENWATHSRDFSDRQRAQSVFGKVLDKVAGKTTEELEKKAKANAVLLKDTLDSVCEAVKVDDYPPKEHAPYKEQYQLAEGSIDLLKKQKTALEGWRADLDRWMPPVDHVRE